MPVHDFSAQLRRKLEAEFESQKARRLAGTYDTVASKLLKTVYKKIGSVEPSLTDHSGQHVDAVLANAVRLLAADREIRDELSAIEMYCLGMIILFHDAGIIYGRNNHHKNVAKVFDKIRGRDRSLLHERTLIVKAARAHTGIAQDGTKDTLKEIPEDGHLEGERVRLRELAAIARFADELEEGPERASEFMLKHESSKIQSDSKIFHEYALSVHTRIDRHNSRIVLTYELDLDINGTLPERRNKILEFLTHAYGRIQKADQERRYVRHYSELLRPFQSTEITFNFHCGDELLQVDLPKIQLTDLLLPGESTKKLEEVDSSYEIPALVDTLLSKCPGERK